MGMLKKIVLTGTGTNVGKTFLSLALCKLAKDSDRLGVYYKPLQCGQYTIEGYQGGDADWISHHCPGFPVFTGYNLKEPCSPHLAAEKEKCQISMEYLENQIAEFEKKYSWILIEGAGGICVPFDRRGSNLAELSKKVKASVVVAALPGLGTLNHTLLTLYYLKTQGAQVSGFFFIQTQETPEPLLQDNYQTIEQLSNIPYLGLLPYTSSPVEAKILPTASFHSWWN